LLTGQGTSLALAGAYVLAGELAAHDDPSQAFASYERITRPYVEANQALVTQQNASFALPRTQADIDARNRMLAGRDKGDTQGEDPTGGVYNALRLPDYRRYVEV
jgi:2-polyprenyl-6-methoxyphenol hydroxylase-like FAD-dependent oxidoreductase